MLNISHCVYGIRLRMSVVPNRNEFFALYKLAVNNVQGCIFLTRWLQSALIPSCYDAERCRETAGIKPTNKLNTITDGGARNISTLSFRHSVYHFRFSLQRLLIFLKSTVPIIITIIPPKVIPQIEPPTQA